MELSPARDVRELEQDEPEAFGLVAVVSLAEEEINPLAPCGACREWLLKLAAVNPDFEVLTFPNDRCESVFSERIVGA